MIGDLSYYYLIIIEGEQLALCPAISNERET